jgi:hypothetical protein
MEILRSCRDGFKVILFAPIVKLLHEAVTVQPELPTPVNPDPNFFGHNPLLAEMG